MQRAVWRPWSIPPTPPPDELKELLARSGGVGAIPEEPVRLDAVDDDLRSALVVPMHSEGGTIGVLALYTTRRRFQPRELEVLRLYADRTAVAVENARLRRRHEQVAVLEERQRLARELHDSVSQSVYGVSLYAEAAARHLESGTIERAVEYLHELRDTAVEALRLMRLLIFEMRPSTLVESGLIAVLEERLASVEGRTGVSTDLQCNLEERLPSQIEDALHGIAHEALNNALKHAHAGRISVRLQGGDGGLSLELVDDGVGFDLDKARSRGGLGLRGMVERASRIGAELIIDSSPGEGTRVRVALGQGSGYPGRGVT